jgi:hypothetical protein
LRRHVNALGQQLDDHQPVFEGLVTDNEPADVVLCELSIKLPHVHVDRFVSSSSVSDTSSYLNLDCSPFAAFNASWRGVIQRLVDGA